MVMDEFYGIRVESNNKPSYARRTCMEKEEFFIYCVDTMDWIQQDGGDSIKIENHDMSPLKTHFDTMQSNFFKPGELGSYYIQLAVPVTFAVITQIGISTERLWQ